jgi:hypothetical protein
MSYEIVLTEQPEAETGALRLRLDQTIEIGVSAQEARRRVNNWAHLEISGQMRADDPQLVLSPASSHWRVPLRLTFPTLGDVGMVGYILVDVTNGLFSLTAEQISEIKQNAHTLAQRFASAST